MSRLGFFPRPGPSNSNAGAKVGSSSYVVEDDDDWCIPYNGPREPNTERFQEELEQTRRDQQSWGRVLHGWLSDDGHGMREVYGEHDMKANTSTPNLERTRSRSGSKTRTRQLSSATSTSNNAHSRGFVDPGRGGGVGECPTPVERAPTHDSSTSTSSESLPRQKSRRASLASIFTFGRKSLRLSLSMDNVITGDLSRKSSGRLRAGSNVELPVSSEAQNMGPSTSAFRRRANTSIRQPGRFANDLREEPEEEYYNSYYSTLIVTPAAKNTSPPNSAGLGSNSSLRSHPYAYPFHDTPGAPATATATQSNENKQPIKARLITLLDPRSSSRVPDYLKPSPRNSILKASLSTPNLRGTQEKIAKGKQKWLSAETWCDAIFLPRPRFAIRLVEAGEGEGKSNRGHGADTGRTRIVSPPGSVIPTPRNSPSPSDSPRAMSPVEPTSMKERALQMKEMKSPRKVRSLKSLLGETTGKSKGKERETAVGSVQQESRGVLGVDRARGGPERPKSWALDDLALPSPVPSLAKVLEEGRQLELERQAWKRTASKSFLDSAAHSISRARSRSLGGGTASAATLSALRAKHKESEAEAFEELRQSKFETLKGRTLERTLVGGQVRPPTIHVRGPSSAGRRRSRSRSRDALTLRGSSTQGHTIRDTQTGTATHTGTRSHAHSNSLGNSIAISDATHPHSQGHGRGHSLSKGAMKLVVGAAAFCGVGGQSPAEEKEGQSIAAAFSGDGMKQLGPDDLMGDTAHFAHGGKGNPDARSSPSPNTILAIPGPGGIHGVSPTLSSEGTGEIGVAITAPMDDSSHQQAGREPIRIRHPYAAGSRYSEQDPAGGASGGEEIQEETRHRQPVLVHPYASASPQIRTQISPLPSTSRNNRPPHLMVPPPEVPSSIFAELSPGHIREFNSREIRYSPEIRTPIVVLPTPYKQDTRDLGAVETGTIYVRPPPGSPPPALPNDQQLEVPEYVYDNALSTSGAAHPFGASTKRTSQLMFGDALARTLSMRRGSMDSGLGTSEAEHEHVVEDGGSGTYRTQEQAASQSQPPYYATSADANIEESPDADAIDDIVRTHDMYDPIQPGEPSYFGGSTIKAGVAISSPDVLSNATHASSPLENIVPPAFRRTASGISGVSGISAMSNVSLPVSLKERLAINLNGHSSGSSPGMTSHESSPPLSPRPINTMEDWERFRDLFYRPPEIGSVASLTVPAPPESDHREGKQTTTWTNINTHGGVAPGGPTGTGIPVDVSPPGPSRPTHLLGLARQLSEDLEELKKEQQSPSTPGSQRTDDPMSPHADPDGPIMWGRRYGGLKGVRPEGIENPDTVLARFGSKEKMRSTSGFSLHLRMPDEPGMESELGASLEGPESNVPEDVESELSSVYDLGQNEDITENFRFGAIEAMLTPPIVTTVKRFSSEPDLVSPEGSLSPEAGSSVLVPQAPSPVGELPLHLETRNITPPFTSEPSLFSPHSHNVRSSYMTSNTDFSRMSGLSDFPEPPTIPRTISLIESASSNSDAEFGVLDRRHLVLPARLVREPSHGTFGQSRTDLGREYHQGQDIFEEEEYEGSVVHAL